MTHSLTPRDKGNLPAVGAPPLIRLDAYVAEDGSTVVNGHLLDMGGTRPPNEAILDAVAMFARTLGAPVAATVIDRTAQQVARLRVHPDGSSRTIGEEEDLPPGRERTAAEEEAFPPLRPRRTNHPARAARGTARRVRPRQRAAGTPHAAPGRRGRTVPGGEGDRGVPRVPARRLHALHRPRADRRPHPLPHRPEPGRPRRGPRHQGMAAAVGRGTGGHPRAGTAAHVGTAVRGGPVAGTVPPRHGAGRAEQAHPGRPFRTPAVRARGGGPDRGPRLGPRARRPRARRPRGQAPQAHPPRPAPLYPTGRPLSRAALLDRAQEARPCPSRRSRSGSNGCSPSARRSTGRSPGRCWMCSCRNPAGGPARRRLRSGPRRQQGASGHRGRSVPEVRLLDPGLHRPAALPRVGVRCTSGVGMSDRFSRLREVRGRAGSTRARIISSDACPSSVKPVISCGMP
ncbi:hypothetical protein SVIOM342S_04216 [Streptomyces violaceorubidus]